MGLKQLGTPQFRQAVESLSTVVQRKKTHALNMRKQALEEGRQGLVDKVAAQNLKTAETNTRIANQKLDKMNKFELVGDLFPELKKEHPLVYESIEPMLLEYAEKKNGLDVITGANKVAAMNKIGPLVVKSLINKSKLQKKKDLMFLKDNINKTPPEKKEEFDRLMRRYSYRNEKELDFGIETNDAEVATLVGQMKESNIQAKKRTDPNTGMTTDYGRNVDTGEIAWTGKPTKTDLTPKEKEDLALGRKGNRPLSTADIAVLDNMDPNVTYMKHDFRVNDDGTVYKDPFSGQPTKLPSPEKVLGKRGNIKAALGLGRAWDDAQELTELLKDPIVMAGLKKASSEGMWDQATGSFSNKIKTWMQGNGITGNSKTAQAVARIQYMASEKRKEYLGTAVTEMEIKSARGWLPEAGDSFETIAEKTKLMSHEAEEAFTQFLDVWKNKAAMGDFYKAFGMERFQTTTADRSSGAQSSPTSKKATLRYVPGKGVIKIK